MNEVQWKSTLTTMVTAIGTLLVVFGFMPKEAIDYVIENISGVVDAAVKIIGFVTFVGGFAWKIWTNTKANLVTKTANLPEVESIKVNTSELAGASTPENVTR